MREGWWNWNGWPLPEEWSAFWAALGLVPALVAAGAAVLAAVLARHQLRELIRSNRELSASNHTATQANVAAFRPYVTVDLKVTKLESRQPGGPLRGTVDIVVNNVGRSPAKDVRLSVDPPWDASAAAFNPEAREEHLGRLRKLFDGAVSYPVLHPARSFRYMLDQAPEGVRDLSIPRSYTVTARYTTLDGQYEFEESYILGLDALGPSFVESDMARRISKDLQAIDTSLGKVSDRLRTIGDAVEDLRDETDDQGPLEDG